MKLESKLSITAIALFLFSFNANADETKACNEAINKKDAPAALKLSETILKQKENNHEGLLCKARALGLQKKYAEAENTFKQAIDATQDPFFHTIAYMLLGNLHKTNGKIDAAIAHYTKSLDLCAKRNDQTYSRINHHLIGDAHLQAKDLNAALDSYLVAVRLSNNDNERAQSFSQTAATYNALGQYEKAVEFQVKAALMQQKAGTLNDYADASLMLGQYHYNAKDYTNAARTYEKLAKFAQDNGGAYYEAKANFRLAEALYANGDKAAAKPLIDSALDQANTIGAKHLASEINTSKKKLNI